MLSPMPDTQTVQPVTAEPISLQGAIRTHAVATLHSVAQSFADAPTEPMPTDVEMSRYDLTIAQFTAFVDTHAAKVRFGTVTWWAEIPLATYDTHGVNVRMIVHLHRDARTDVHRRALETHNSECVID